MSTQEVRAIFEAYWGAISAGKLDNLEQFFTEDAVFEDTTLGHVWRGRDEIVDILRKFFSAMPTRLKIDSSRARETDSESAGSIPRSM